MWEYIGSEDGDSDAADDGDGLGCTYKSYCSGSCKAINRATYLACLRCTCMGVYVPWNGGLRVMHCACTVFILLHLESTHMLTRTHART